MSNEDGIHTATYIQPTTPNASNENNINCKQWNDDIWEAFGFIYDPNRFEAVKIYGIDK